MPTLVFIESSDGEVKKTSVESVCYAAAMDDQVVALALGPHHEGSSLAALGQNGATEILHDSNEIYATADLGLCSNAIFKIMEDKGADKVVFATSPFGSALASRVAVKADASIATNVTGLPDTSEGFKVERSIFTGKAFETVKLEKQKKVIAIRKNAVEITEKGAAGEVSAYDAGVSGEAAVVVESVDKVEGDILLPEAERVVSGGRGLKGPENWGMIEELAKLLGAATACSKPVSDMEWRPHHEHVGQTGIKISPQLYIAIGISGAIQHLAGVNSSKYIVVINKDPEAPFFQEADYGIVGDAFEVVPKLIEAIKAAN